jgi:HSP20 family molecular chaperone IbpA
MINNKLKTRGNQFLSGFASTNILNEFYSESGGDEDPVINVSQNDERFKIEMGLPGYDTEDISINVDDPALKIEAKNEERSLFKKFFLPSVVRMKDVTAKYNDGMLEIFLPKDQSMPLNESFEIEVIKG